MKQGQSEPYRGRTIHRLKNPRRGERAYVIQQRLSAPRTYATKADAKAAIRADLELAKSQRKTVDRGLPRVGDTLTYETRIIERIEDSKGNAKRYRVHGMVDEFRSIDVAVARIAWTVKSEELRANPPQVDGNGWNRNYEK